MIITSIDNDKVKFYRKLEQKKYREEYQKFIVEGMHLVLEAYREGMVEELILEENEVIPLDVPYVYVTKEVIRSISTMDTPTTVMALCKKKVGTEIIGDRILILDQIQDPGNLGTIIRSAVAFDVTTIVLSENTVDLYNPKVLRGTQGMLFHINVVQMPADEIINILHEKSIPVYGTSVLYGIDVRELPKKDREKYALVVGNEGNGVRSVINKMCDKGLYIKMNSSVESLNVGVATSILLYELGR